MDDTPTPDDLALDLRHLLECAGAGWTYGGWTCDGVSTRDGRFLAWPQLTAAVCRRCLAAEREVRRLRQESVMTDLDRRAYAAAFARP